MPIFDFKCTNKKCKQYNKIRELMVKSHKGNMCPECKQALQRIWSGTVGLDLKGSGFHVNDYPK